MKAKLLLALCAVLALTGCQKIENTDVEETTTTKVQTKNVKFNITGLFTDTEEFTTRASLSDDGLTDLFVVDTDGSILAHQVSTDSDFGHPNIKMTYGKHELAFIATKATNTNIVSGSMTMDKVKMTYAKYATLNVSSTTLTQSIQLERIVCGLKLTTEDSTNDAISSVEVTVGNYGASLSVPSLQGGMVADRAMSITFNNDTFKSTGIGLTFYGFTPTIGTEYKTSVTIKFKDASGAVLYTHTLSEVPLKSNRVTNIHGSFFGYQTSQTLSINDVWDEQKDVQL